MRSRIIIFAIVIWLFLIAWSIPAERPDTTYSYYLKGDVFRIDTIVDTAATACKIAQINQKLDKIILKLDEDEKKQVSNFGF